MKKVVLLAVCYCFSALLNAQIVTKPTPIVKAPIAAADSNSGIKQPVRIASTIKRVMPTTVTDNLIFYKWKASRLMHNAFGTYYLTAPNFIFYSNGTVSYEVTLFSGGVPAIN